MPLGNLGDKNYGVSGFDQGADTSAAKSQKQLSPTEKKTEETSKAAFSSDDWKNRTGVFQGLNRDQAWDKLMELKGLTQQTKEFDQIGKEMVEQQTRTGPYRSSGSKGEDYIITVAITLGVSVNSARELFRGKKLGETGVESPTKNVEMLPFIIKQIGGLRAVEGGATAESMSKHFQDDINEIFQERFRNLEKKYSL